MREYETAAVEPKRRRLYELNLEYIVCVCERDASVPVQKNIILTQIKDVITENLPTYTSAQANKSMPCENES